MNLQILVILMLLTGTSLVASSIFANSVFAIPEVKIMRPSICETHPGLCDVVSLKIQLGCPPICQYIIPHEKPGPIERLTEGQSLIVIPISATNNSRALVIRVPTQDIQIGNLTGNLTQAQ